MEIKDLLIYLAAINFITFLFYGFDKHSAKKNMFRVSEKTLLLLAFIGGTPAALIGRAFFRHKTKKKSFIAKLWVTIILQIIIGGFAFSKLYIH